MTIQRTVCAGFFAACVWLAPVSFAQTVTGTATYRERMALPPDAVFEATLEDVSRAGAPAIILGRARLEKPGQPPFRFTISYDPVQIQAGRTYSVRARVTVGGDLWFTSDQAHPVLTQGKGREVSILMRRATGPAGPVETQAEKTGMFIYKADAPVFMDCQNRRWVPVAMEGAYLEMEKAYTKLRQQPGEELLVTVEGQILDRPSLDGGHPVPTLVADRYINFWPGETCGTARANFPLQETFWRLTRLQGNPVILNPNQREPNLVFHSAGNRVTGYGGCNELTGAYTLKGNAITFSGVAMTQRACLDGGDMESVFSSTLGQVRSWKIFGEHLELYDASGKLLARFEARALK